MKKVDVVYYAANGGLNLNFEADLAVIMRKHGLVCVGSGMMLAEGARDMEFILGTINVKELTDSCNVWTDSGDDYVYFTKWDSFYRWLRAAGWDNEEQWEEETHTSWSDLQGNPFFVVSQQVFILKKEDMKDEPIKKAYPIDWNEF